MNGIFIKIKEGHKIDGEGEAIGRDSLERSYTFWRSSGQMQVPLDLAFALEKEVPQRYEIVDRDLAVKLMKCLSLGTKPEPKKKKVTKKLESVKEKDNKPKVKDAVPIKSEPIKKEGVVLADPKVKFSKQFIEENITLKELKGMTRDELNDWAAKRDYEANPFKDSKSVVIEKLVKQIEARTGKKVK